ncbi:MULTISPECIES: hypothetical protein [Amycolatopsis methanolica group]|uniref:hypothetical protein n=1 Tax=Amycolatopsis methanolica group TaxID=2893674 RepID=UPI00344626B4
MSLRDIYIAMQGEKEDEFTEPPARELRVSVIGGIAHLSVVDLEEGSDVRGHEGPVYKVSARTLVTALQAAIEDDAR